MPTPHDKPDRTWLYDAAKLLVAVLVSTVTSAVAAVWTVRGMIDEHDRRLSIVETKTLRIETDIVPRREHEARWSAQEKSMQEVKEATRDIQTDIKALLRKP